MVVKTGKLYLSALSQLGSIYF